MSQPNLPAFTWPLAAPGAQGKPTSLCSASSAKKTVHVKVASIILHTSAAGTSNAPIIHQTQTLGLHNSIVPTKVHTLVPEVTVASLDLFNPPPDVSVTIKGIDIPTLNLSFSPATALQLSSSPSLSYSRATTSTLSSSSDLSPAAISGITLSILAFITIITSLAIFLYRRRKYTKNKPDMEASKTEETLEEKVERARGFQRKRWSMQETKKNQEQFKKLKAQLATKREITAVDKIFIVGDGEEDGKTGKKEVRVAARPEAARRPSGLEMHPPTSVDAVEMKNSDPKDGRAM